VLVALAVAACGRSQPPTADPVEVGAGTAPAPTPTEVTLARKVDPRQGGFEIGFGEFAVTLEAPAIRPGPVTFVIRNGGELVHGFEMEAQGADSSGPGSGKGFKIERPTFGPGEEVRVDLDLGPGIYKIECFVANHDDRGMEALLDVRPDAPKIREEPAGAGNAVGIHGFAFDPPTLEVAAGTEVTWTNHDPTDHTVTAEDGSFDSGPLSHGLTFSVTVDRDTTYVCSIHPTMKGTITVG
jgi:plastocyanin